MRSTILAILLVFSLASCAQTEKKSVIDKFKYEGIGKPVLIFHLGSSFEKFLYPTVDRDAF